MVDIAKWIEVFRAKLMEKEKKELLARLFYKIFKFEPEEYRFKADESEAYAYVPVDSVELLGKRVQGLIFSLSINNEHILDLINNEHILDLDIDTDWDWDIIHIYSFCMLAKRWKGIKARIDVEWADLDE
jgi:hypothetical protein